MGGKLEAPASGKYKLGLRGNDGFRLYLDGKIINRPMGKTELFNPNNKC